MARLILRGLSIYSLLLMVLLLALVLILWNETWRRLLSLGLYDASNGVIIERRLLKDDRVLTLTKIVI